MVNFSNYNEDEEFDNNHEYEHDTGGYRSPDKGFFYAPTKHINGLPFNFERTTRESYQEKLDRIAMESQDHDYE